MEFVRKLVSWAAPASALWAAALNHEFRNHPVKYEPVVIILLLFLAGAFVGKFLGAFDQSYEILDGFRRFLFEKFYHDVALRSLENRRTSLMVGSCTLLVYPFILHEPPPPAPLALLPAFLFPQFGNVRRVVLAMPFIEKDQPVHRAFAMLRMNQSAGEMLRL